MGKGSRQNGSVTSGKGMALKAGAAGLSAGSSRPTGGPGETSAVKSVPFTGYCGVPLLRSPGQPGSVQPSING